MGDTIVDSDGQTAPLALLRQQPTHFLFLAANSGDAGDEAFSAWLTGRLGGEIASDPGVVSAHHYKQHAVDITAGRHARFPFDYLGLYALSIDGGDRAASLIASIRAAFDAASLNASGIATWLYFTIGAKVGASLPSAPMITVAYANCKEGTDAEFREFYATRHVRHALNISALVSGQCLERAQFQDPGVMNADFQMICVYEQTGPPEAIIEAFKTLPPGTLSFPALDTSPGRFAECTYCLLD